MWWKRKHRDFQAEIEAHLRLEEDELQAEGLDPEVARARARRTFGNRTATEERFFESGRWMLWDHMLRDMRLAVRVLRKDAVFSGLAILGLALGIGVSTAIFAVVHAIVAQGTEEIQDPRSYVGFARMVQGRGENLSYAEYRYYQDHATSFRAVDAYSGRVSLVLGLAVKGRARTEAEDLDGRFVSANFLLSRALTPALGRSFTPEEEEQAAPVAVLNFGFWKRRFSSDADILGKTLVIDAHPLTVIGIADARYGALDRAAIYIPLTLQPALADRDDLHDASNGWLNVGARLRPGVTARQAQAEIDVLSRDLPRNMTGPPADSSTLIFEGGGGSPEKRRSAYAAAFAGILAVSMILLIACSNLANLLLARAAVRRQEIGVRLSLGASRSRLVCQLLTESMLMAAAGGVLGLTFSNWLARFMAALLASSPGLDPRPEPAVILYASMLAAAAGTSFGLGPALAATKTNVAQALHADSFSVRTGPQRMWRLRNLLVIVPFAVSLMMLMSAGMTVRSVERIYGSRPAFATANLIGLSFRLNLQGYDEARTRRFQQNLSERIGRMPGVASVALAGGIPFEMGRTRLLTNGTPPAENAAPRVSYNVVSQGFFGALGAPMVRGRTFSTSDREGAPPVAIVNQFLARKYWPDEDVVGRRVRLAVAGSALFDVIGVVQDLEDPTELTHPVEPTVYTSYGQASLLKANPTDARPYQMHVLVRTSADPEGLRRTLRHEVLAADPSLLVNIQTMDELMETRLGPVKTISMLLSALGGLSLAMASVGIYAILAYAVSQRTREIGIRMALGAQRREIVALVMRRTVMLIAWGVGVGLIGVGAMTKILGSAIANFGSLDAVTCALVVLVLCSVAMVASYLPARRALRVDPMRALRWE